jgi:hypothetical protein
MRTWLFVIACAGSLAGISGCSEDAVPLDAAPTIDATAFLAASEPQGAKTVIEARECVADGDEVVVVGRIGGSTDPWVKGMAAFLIVDQSLVPCNEREGDTCPTPWDYCCDLERLPKSKAMVRIVDEQEQVIPADAKHLLKVKELETIVVQGKAKRDEAGNLTVLARKVFVRR